MPFYRCGGKNHYDEGYTAGYANGKSRGLPAGRAAQKARGSTQDVRNAYVSDNRFSVTFPWRVDAIVDATCQKDDGDGEWSGGVAGISFSGSTVSGWIVARFAPQYVSITAKHFYSLDA
ncbi:hypothetical protein [Butyrivibrio sp. INlla21]|uniref:hypothetical protein n=1 Tax=Butyrivibrio sp. INlla21 TaxID=1520811 RepID=UPI0008E1548D|nr:hypothetical protein [Butyrivibrio sp. INlla21]SFU35633.1 hypothetical protein SAMN02910342_00217 [Butyrivibrio sp. INlla21]